MPGRVSRRASWVLVVLILVLLCVFLPPFLNVNRYRNQVANSIGRALGHSVAVSNIELKLLPRPGLVLYGFVVAEDPAFGAEPLLRCETVTAYLRLNSLWRGRLEIGTLALEGPSINLVRRSDGRWNLEQILERASQTQSAPTSQGRPERTPRFPYVEATLGRINLKLDQTKKPFALTEADLALWLESDREWGVRLEARPTRTDVPVGDTGVLRLDGRIERAHTLRETPVNLKVNYAKGQLGQITALIYGRDRGWRGGLTSAATLAGTPSSLGVTLDAELNDFRRFDIALGEALTLAVHCTGTYSSIDDSLRAIQCQSPVRPGLLMLRGDVEGWDGRSFDLGVTAEQIPLGRLVALARHTKKDLPEDLTATGSTDALFTVRRTSGMRPEWAGGGRTTRFALQSSVLKPDLDLGPLEYTIAQETVIARPRHAKAPKLPAGDPSLRAVIQPFAIPVGASSPATATAYFDLTRYKIDLSGDSDLVRLLSVAHAMGIATPPIALSGPAHIDLSIAGAWTGFAQPMPSGTMQLHNTTVGLPGVLEPLHLAAATAVLAEHAVSINAFDTRLKDGLSVTGSASFPMYCTNPSDCVIRFDLRSPEMSLARLNQLFNPASQDRPWYQIPGFAQPGSNVFAKVQGHGHISIGHFSIGNLIALNVSSNLDIRTGTFSLRELAADLLGGHHSGNWDLDFSSNPPKYFGSGSVNRVNMAQVFSLLHTTFATGAISGQYTLGLAGADAQKLRSSATGSGTFKWTAGTLLRVSLTEQGLPLTFSNFEGSFALQNGNLICQDCKMKTSSASYSVSGNSGLNRTLSLRLEQISGPSYAVSGPLENPVVEQITVPSAQAKLQ